MPENFAEGVRWDLSDLYASRRDPAIDADLKRTRSLALSFENKYKPLFAKNGTAGTAWLAELLKDLKEIQTLSARLGTFAHLSFAEKTDDAESGAFMQKISVELTDIGTHLLFFEVAWSRLDDAAAKAFIADEAVRADRHFLEKMRTWAPHTLSEGEEKVMSVKANTGVQAFSRLFDESVNSIVFTVEQDGKTQTKTEGEVLALLHSTDRPTRQMAAASLAAGLKENSRLLTYIYNMVLADHRADLKLRKLAHPMDAMDLSNEIELKSVLNLVDNVKKAYPIVARFMRLKKKLLGLDRLFDYDRYAPVAADEAKVPFGECKKIVLSGYRAFSEEAGKIAEMFFEKRWIDAEVRTGKQGGGFCCGTTPELHPYVLVNYTGNMRDVMTVAHELGHGLHQMLARRAGIIEQHAPLTMAETASVFGEMIIFEKLLSSTTDKKKKLALICGKIDDNFATVFRQIAMTDFELMAHEAGLKEGELAADRLSDIWIEANTRLYGDSVTLTENYRQGWKYIPHFIHSPFYCYAYAFAQLFVLTLFKKYKQEGKSFIPKYFEMLALGGSRKPAELARLMDIDLNDPAFWQQGLRLLEELVSEAEQLAA